MQGNRVPANTIDQEQVRSQLTFGKAREIGFALCESVLVKRFRQSVAGDHEVENVLERLGVKLGVFASCSVIAPEARQDNQLSSQWMASRPLRNRRPFPADSSFKDCLSAARSSDSERLGFARPAQSLSAAAGLFLPVRALSARISPLLS